MDTISPNIKLPLKRTPLCEYSPTDGKFDGHKASSAKIAALYGLDGNKGLKGFICGSRVVEFEKYQSRISGCGTWLKFWETADNFKLSDARFCKVPYCPMCQFRRSLKWRAKFLGALPEIQSQYPSEKWVFLTLTLKNCDLSELRETVQDMGKAFNRLSKLASYPFTGCIKSLEVTRVWDWYDEHNQYLGRHGVTWWYRNTGANKQSWTVQPTDEVHPHYHVLGMVDPSYFGKGYITQAQWSDMWGQSLRLDYVPIVNIKKIKGSRKLLKTKISDTPTDSSLNDFEAQMLAGLCETLKYTIKEQDLLGTFCLDDDINSDWLKEITEQLYLLRRVEYRGNLKAFGKDVEASLENLINIDDKEPEIDKKGKEVLAFWSKQLGKYLVNID